MQTTISATDLARNTREILDRVVSGRETVAIVRNQTLIAHIMPAQSTMTASQALAGLQPPLLTATQAKAWLSDSKANFSVTTTCGIAAQTIEHGYTLLTLNAKDFADLPGLRFLTLATATD
jgi:antitoxin (DNA-binding transcriptional repressor) of toxin-antitoxin stability system